jgi:hypothetical protein
MAGRSFPALGRALTRRGRTIRPAICRPVKASLSCSISDLEDVGGAGEGEGPRFDTKRASSKLRRNAIAELPASVTVTETSGTTHDKPSLFEYRWPPLEGRANRWA